MGSLNSNEFLGVFNELHVSSGGSIIFVIKAPVLFIRHEKVKVKLSAKGRKWCF